MVSEEIAHNILYKFLGWKKLKENVMTDILSKHKRIVVVYPHTVPQDYLSVLLYSKIDPELKKHVNKIILAADAFDDTLIGKIFGTLALCSHVKKIKIKKTKNSGNGNVQNIISELEKIPEWIFIISPKIIHRKDYWRSGWFHVANHFNVPILVAGPDYNTQEMKIFNENLIYIKNREYKEVETEVKKYYSQIIPLLKDKDPSVKVRPYNYVSVFSIHNYISMIIISLLIICCFIFSIYTINKKVKIGIPRLMDRYSKKN